MLPGHLAQETYGRTAVALDLIRNSYTVLTRVRTTGGSANDPPQDPNRCSDGPSGGGHAPRKDPERRKHSKHSGGDPPAPPPNDDGNDNKDEGYEEYEEEESDDEQSDDISENDAAGTRVAQPIPQLLSDIANLSNLLNALQLLGNTVPKFKEAGSMKLLAVPKTSSISTLAHSRSQSCPGCFGTP